MPYKRSYRSGSKTLTQRIAALERQRSRTRTKARPKAKRKKRTISPYLG